jgi:hypothetical protein
MPKKKVEYKKGLTEAELIEKYGDIVPPEFNEVVRNMLMEANPAIYKPEKVTIINKGKSAGKIKKP